MTPNRREFFKTVASAAAGLVVTACQWTKAAQPGRQQSAGPKRRRVVVAGRRIKTVDIHAHCQVPDALELVKGYEWGDPLRTSMANRDYGLQLNLSRIAERIDVMDVWGIDVQALSINPFWYAAERAIATDLIDLQNERLAEVCFAHSDRFAGMATVALQFPDLAAQQLERCVKRMGMRSCLIGGSVNGIELSARQFDPFWTKAEELGVLVFIHPQNGVFGAEMSSRLQGNGFLRNVIGNPLETTIALSHLMWEGTLDRYPGLKICAAQGGGYLPSYIGRSEACFDQVASPGACRATQKHPREYLKQLYFDSLVFTAEGLRYLAAGVGASRIMLGTDYPYGWTSRAVDQILATPGFSNVQREEILGGTASRLLGLRV